VGSFSSAHLVFDQLVCGSPRILPSGLMPGMSAAVRGGVPLGAADLVDGEVGRLTTHIDHDPVRAEDPRGDVRPGIASIFRPITTRPLRGPPARNPRTVEESQTAPVGYCSVFG
jgi:hypothetical protein